MPAVVEVTDPERPRPPYIAVIGASAAGDEHRESAEEVGREIARMGGLLLCGGLTGVMEAACRGAKSAGGTTVGFLPGEERGAENEFVDIALPTGMGEMRNMLIMRAADAVIAIGGEFGTLSELAFALRIGKPVIGIDTWELSKRGRVSDAMKIVEDPAEAVRTAVGLV